MKLFFVNRKYELCKCISRSFSHFHRQEESLHPGKKGNPCGHKGKRRDKCCDMTQNLGLAGYARNPSPPSLPRFSKIYRPNFSHFPHAFLHLFQTFIFCAAAVGIWVTLKQRQGGCLFSKPSTVLVSFFACAQYLFTLTTASRKISLCVRQTTAFGCVHFATGKALCVCVAPLFLLFPPPFCVFKGSGLHLAIAARSKRKKNLFFSFFLPWESSVRVCA